jgi:hypothetical protein
MKNKLIYYFIFFSLFNYTFYGQDFENEFERMFNKTVSFDGHFSHDGTQLYTPEDNKYIDDKDSCELYSTIEEKGKKPKKIYNCKKDGYYKIIILSNHEGGDFELSHIDSFGINLKSLGNIPRVKARKGVTSTFVDNKLVSQMVCDYDESGQLGGFNPKSFKCHLLTEKICDLYENVRKSPKEHKPWNQFINYLKSDEYQELFEQEAIKAYKDTYIGLNYNAWSKANVEDLAFIRKDWDGKDRRELKQRLSEFESTLDLIKKMHKKKFGNEDITSENLLSFIETFAGTQEYKFYKIIPGTCIDNAHLW